MDDEDDRFELAVPVGDFPHQKSWVQEVKERDRRESEGVTKKN